MFGVFPLTPAYGRDYKTKAEAEADFKAGKDFVTSMGQYCSRRDFEIGTRIELRFKRMTLTHSFVLN